MNRQCTECGEKTLNVEVLSLTRPMHCNGCFSKYELSVASKRVLSFVTSFIPCLAIVLFFYFQSWVVLVAILVVTPFVTVFLMARFGTFELVGVRGLWRQMREEQNSQP